MHQDCTAPEEWRPVVGYEGWYSVSSYGRVRRDMPVTGSRAGRILMPKLDRRGYVRTGLSRDRKRSFYYVHALVAEAFIRPREGTLTVNHINGSKTDNRPSNLEWVTLLRNIEHAGELGLRATGARNGAYTRPDRRPAGERSGTHKHPESYQGSRNGRAKLTDDMVREIRASPLGARRLSRRYGVAESLIGRIKNRTAWRHITA